MILTQDISQALFIKWEVTMKKQFVEVEFQLSEPFQAGQGLALSYRNRLDEDFKIIGTFTHTTLGAISSHVHPQPGILPCEFVQIKAALENGSSNTLSSPHLRKVTLR